MKKLLLGAAISTALFGGAANAAITLTATNLIDSATQANATALYISGSSAQQGLIESSLTSGGANSFCKAGTIYKFIDAPSSGSDQAAYACTANTLANGGTNTALPVATKTNLVIFKQNKGGSLQGLLPLSVATNLLPFLNVTATAAPGPAPLQNGAANAVIGTVSTGCTLAAAQTGFLNVFSCAYDSTVTTGMNTTATNDLGLLDVNPAILTVASENVPANAGVVSTPSLTGITVKTGADAIFGVAVTTKLRNALQEQQFATTSVCNPRNIGYTAALAESEACMPDLQSTFVAALFSGYPAPVPATNLAKGAGKINSWTQLNVGNSLNNLFSLTTKVANKPGSAHVHICSRTIGSGTKAQFGARFLRTACEVTPHAYNPVVNFDFTGTSEPSQILGSPVPFVAHTNQELETIARPQVHAMGSSGGLAECLDELDSGANNTTGSFAPGTAYSAQSAGNGVRWAIGFQSTDKNANLSKAYRFVKIDGASPTIQNVASGKYHDWVEATWVFKTASPALQLALSNAAISSFGNPIDISAVNTASAVHPWGVSGFLSNPTLYAASAVGFVNPAAPVNPLTYSVYAPADDCRVPVLWSTPTNTSQGIQIAPYKGSPI